MNFTPEQLEAEKKSRILNISRGIRTEINERIDSGVGFDKNFLFYNEIQQSTFTPLYFALIDIKDRISNIQFPIKLTDIAVQTLFSLPSPNPLLQSNFIELLKRIFGQDTQQIESNQLLIFIEAAEQVYVNFLILSRPDKDTELPAEVLLFLDFFLIETMNTNSTEEFARTILMPLVNGTLDEFEEGVLTLDRTPRAFRKTLEAKRINSNTLDPQVLKGIDDSLLYGSDHGARELKYNPRVIELLHEAIAKGISIEKLLIIRFPEVQIHPELLQLLQEATGLFKFDRNIGIDLLNNTSTLETTKLSEIKNKLSSKFQFSLGDFLMQYSISLNILLTLVNSLTVTRGFDDMYSNMIAHIVSDTNIAGTMIA